MINALFNVLNFAALIAVAVYVWKRFVAGALRQQRAFEQLSHEGLVRQKEELRKQQQGLVVSMERQELEYQRLQEHMRQWRERVAADARLRHEQCNTIAQRIRARRAQQEQDMRTAAIHAQVIPQAVADAKVLLQQRFADRAVADAYISRMLMQLDVLQKERA